MNKWVWIDPPERFVIGDYVEASNSDLEGMIIGFTFRGLAIVESYDGSVKDIDKFHLRKIQEEEVPIPEPLLKKCITHLRKSLESRQQ